MKNNASNFIRRLVRRLKKRQVYLNLKRILISKIGARIWILENGGKVDSEIVVVVIIF